MLGIKRLTTPETITSNSFTLGQLAAGELTLGFNVEESEMLIDLELSITFSNDVAERTDFTLFVDGTNLGGAAGLACLTPVALAVNTLYFSTTVRLPGRSPGVSGYHTVEVRAKAPAGTISIAGDVIPAVLVARRHSHPATLGHGVDSKAQLIQ